MARTAARGATSRTALVALAMLLVAAVACSDDTSDGAGDGGAPAAPDTQPGDVELVRPQPVTLVDVVDPDTPDPTDPERGTRSGSPLDDLPDGVRQLVDLGQRPEWSPDGETISFVDGSPLGDIWTVDVESGERRNLTGDLDAGQFLRAVYLHDGDLLVCGPTSGPTPSPEAPEAGRFTGALALFRAPFDEPPVPLGVPCWEGIATAHDSPQIAWNRSDIDYTDPDLARRVTGGITEIWTGEIVDHGGAASIVNARKVLDRDQFGSLAVLEVQDFRPPGDTELLLTSYIFQGGEVFALDLATGELRNVSNSTSYEEAEGVDPSGDALYVERDLESTAEPGALDIWRLGIDDGAYERITTFNRWAPYYASNPTVSPDGTTLAFQLSVDGGVEGQGEGILLLDL